MLRDVGKKWERKEMCWVWECQRKERSGEEKKMGLVGSKEGRKEEIRRLVCGWKWFCLGRKTIR